MPLHLSLFFVLFVAGAQAQDGILSDGSRSLCKPDFVPIRSVGCNRSNPIVCAAAARSVFFACDRQSIARVGDPEDAAYCSNLEIYCDDECQGIKTVTSVMADLSTINNIDFWLEMMQLFFMIGMTFLGSGSIAEEAKENAAFFKFVGLVLMTITDVGLLIAALYHTGQLRLFVPTYLDAECVDWSSQGGLNHHDILKDLSNTADNIFTIGWLELVLIVVTLFMDGVVFQLVVDANNNDVKEEMVYVAIFMQTLTTVMAGIDLYAFTLVAQRKVVQVYGSFDQDQMNAPLVDGLLMNETRLNFGMGDWCVVATNETVACLSSI